MEFSERQEPLTAGEKRTLRLYIIGPLAILVVLLSVLGILLRFVYVTVPWDQVNADAQRIVQAALIFVLFVSLYAFALSVGEARRAYIALQAGYKNVIGGTVTGRHVTPHRRRWYLTIGKKTIPVGLDHLARKGDWVEEGDSVEVHYVEFSGGINLGWNNPGVSFSLSRLQADGSDAEEETNLARRE